MDSQAGGKPAAALLGFRVCAPWASAHMCVYQGEGLTLLELWTWKWIERSILKVGLTSNRGQSCALTATQEGDGWEQFLHPVQCPAGVRPRRQLPDAGVLWPPDGLVKSVMFLRVPSFQTSTGVCAVRIRSRMDQRSTGQLDTRPTSVSPHSGGCEEMLRFGERL